MIPNVNAYLEATKDYEQFENEEHEEPYDDSDYEEFELEEEDQNDGPDEDGWVVVK